MAKDPLSLNTEESLALLFQRIVEFFADGWLLMLAIGVVHAEDHVVPTIGYWQSSFIAWVLAGIALTVHGSTLAKINKLGELVVRRG